jgi:site-specific DNA recombinase
MSKPQLNCAIYTRKSSDEGLEQSFNSLDAQREACEAFIKSQKHEGWNPISTAYDDGGFSGGSMERPALRKLMGDVQAGKVQIIVVYKVDRLTRSLADFAKMVELFDKQNVSFVSVTQQFNTTTSMGRLTLNVLLSFAQFEREVTGERIRDKIAASKAKGMWMGGVVPLGYEPKERTLVPIPAEAEQVRHIFERYLVLESVWDLHDELKRDGIRSKRRILQDGRERGGVVMTRGMLYHLLQNPLYIGQIRHKNKTYSGQHDAIVAMELWDAVQKKLGGNRVIRKNKVQNSQGLLTGFLFYENSEPLTPTSTIRDGRRYRYYVLASTTQKKTKKRLRISAGDIEEIILNNLKEHVAQQADIDSALHRQALDATEVGARRGALFQLVDRIVVMKGRIVIALKDGPQRSIKYAFSTPGRHKGVVADGGSFQAPEGQRQTLLKALVQGYVWRKRLTENSESVTEIAKAEGMPDSYVTRHIHFSMMAPDIAHKILHGDVPAHVMRQRLVYGWFLKWGGQRRLFL